MEPSKSAAADAIEEAIAARTGAHYVLRLYIAGTTAHSARALANIRRICEEHLHDRYELEIVDLSRHMNAILTSSYNLSVTRAITRKDGTPIGSVKDFVE